MHTGERFAQFSCMSIQYPDVGLTLAFLVQSYVFPNYHLHLMSLPNYTAQSAKSDNVEMYYVGNILHERTSSLSMSKEGLKVNRPCSHSLTRYR